MISDYNLYIIFSILRTILQVLIITFMVYRFFKTNFPKRTFLITNGLLLLITIYATSEILDLKIIQGLFNIFLPYSLVIVMVIYQPEIRQFLFSLGSSISFEYWKKRRYFSYQIKVLKEIIEAIKQLSQLKKGALICFIKSDPTLKFIKGGITLNSNISNELLLSIFAYKTPLHDGGVLIKEDKILKAGCWLPLSQQENLRQDLGSRHRAALGLSEESDSVILVVSEETGSISLAYEGDLKSNIESDKLFLEISSLLKRS